MFFSIAVGFSGKVYFGVSLVFSLAVGFRIASVFRLTVSLGDSVLQGCLCFQLCHRLRHESWLRVALFFSFAVGFSRRFEVLFCFGALAPFALFRGLKSQKKGGGLPQPSAEADGKRRTYSTLIQVNRQGVLRGAIPIWFLLALTFQVVSAFPAL